MNESGKKENPFTYIVLWNKKKNRDNENCRLYQAIVGLIMLTVVPSPSALSLCSWPDLLPANPPSTLLPTEPSPACCLLCHWPGQNSNDRTAYRITSKFCRFEFRVLHLKKPTNQPWEQDRAVNKTVCNSIMSEGEGVDIKQFFNIYCIPTVYVYCLF